MTTQTIDYKDYMEIAQELEMCNLVFQKFWEIGKPEISENIPTAEVHFDTSGDFLRYLFSPTLWNSTNKKQRAFIVAHECLHIVLNHGIRSKESISKGNVVDDALLNKAMDIVVNHMLVDKFGMIRTEIDPENIYCWVDTVFPNQNDIKKDQNFEYYYNFLKLKESVEQINGNGESSSTGGGGSYPQNIVDNHSAMSNINSDGVASELQSKMSDEEIQAFADELEKNINVESRGTVGGNFIKWMDLKPVPKKKKWETVIKKWVDKCIKVDFKDNEQWIRISRRISNIEEDIVLPCDMEIDENIEEKDKIDVFFFLDTSGSCVGYASRFWKAAKSLPENKFNIKLFCFDTKIYETSLKTGKLSGFGGTSFHIIENYIQAHIKKNNAKYPSAVFIITDGYGDEVNPEKPKNWYWFLTGSNSRGCIPSTCNIFLLKDFE